MALESIDAVGVGFGINALAIAIRQNGVIDVVVGACIIESEIHRAQIIQRLINLVRVVFFVDVIFIFNATVAFCFDNRAGVVVVRIKIIAVIHTNINKIAVNFDLRLNFVAKQSKNRAD